MACGVGPAGCILAAGQRRVSLLPVLAACAVGVLVGYGILARPTTRLAGHRQLALELERGSPERQVHCTFFTRSTKGYGSTSATIVCFPFPGARPTTAIVLTRSLVYSPPPAVRRATDASFRLLDRRKPACSPGCAPTGRRNTLLLVRSTLYDRIAPDLAGLASLYSERMG